MAGLSYMVEKRRTFMKKNKDDLSYDSDKAFTQLTYGRYIFMAKIAGIIALILVGIYCILIRAGKSLQTTVTPLSVESFLALDEKGRAAFRASVSQMPAREMLRYRTDTVLIVVPDAGFIMPESRGEYATPEERAIYACRVAAIELMLRRSLLEMKYPFLMTRVVLRDSLAAMDLGGFARKEGRFPLYITRKLRPCYGTVFLPDSIAGYFKGLFLEKDVAGRLLEKYVGQGPCGPYRNLTPGEFLRLTPQQRMEQRRAFLNLSEKEQKKARNVHIGVTAGLGCAVLNAPVGPFFKTLMESKMHEQELTAFLGPVLDMATFALMYPMAYIYNKEFSSAGGSESLMMLVGLQSGRAPAHFPLRLKDCPRMLEQGMYADLSQYYEGWEEARHFPVAPIMASTYKGRHYGIPSQVMTADALVYRRDWLEEPAALAWCRAKGWIHPGDRRPYIPLHWTYDEFRELMKLITDTDPSHMRRGYSDRPGPLMYLDAHAGKPYGLGGMYYRPDPSGKNTWVFNRNDSVFTQGMKIVHDIIWKDKSVRTGVEITYDGAFQDFMGGRVFMAQQAAHSVLSASLLEKRSYFGGREYGKVVGMTGFPGCKGYPRFVPAECNQIGLNPFLSPVQRDIAFYWVREKYYGEFVHNRLYYEVAASRLIGAESRICVSAIASPYAVDFSAYGIDPRSIFPPLYIEYYDMLRKSQDNEVRALNAAGVAPRMDDFGLSEPSLRQIQDRVYTMFEQVMMDSLPNYDDVLNEAAAYINTTVLNFREPGAAGALRKYYDATLGFYQRVNPAGIGPLAAVLARSMAQ